MRMYPAAAAAGSRSGQQRLVADGETGARCAPPSRLSAVPPAAAAQVGRRATAGGLRCPAPDGTRLVARPSSGRPRQAGRRPDHRRRAPGRGRRPVRRDRRPRGAYGTGPRSRPSPGHQRMGHHVMIRCPDGSQGYRPVVVPDRERQQAVRVPLAGHRDRMARRKRPAASRAPARPPVAARRPSGRPGAIGRPRDRGGTGVTVSRAGNTVSQGSCSRPAAQEASRASTSPAGTGRCTATGCACRSPAAARSAGWPE